MEYKPHPIDTKDVELPNEIQELQEELAKNTHEIWATQRIEQGWKYGPERNDQKLEHPNLIPFEELTEQDKDYDRKTAIETLKLIISMGYIIRKP